MSESLYRDTLKDHMHHQRFAGRLEPADLKAVVHNPLCGDELELTIVLGGDPSEGTQRPIQEARNPVSYTHLPSPRDKRQSRMPSSA